MMMAVDGTRQRKNWDYVKDDMKSLGLSQSWRRQTG